MSEQDLVIEIKKTKCFLNYPKFKQSIVLRRQNIIHLHDLYGQAHRLGIGYLKQNPNIFHSDFKLIEELVLTKQKLKNN